MSERMGAEIRIGGVCPHEQVQALLDAINTSGASHNYGDSPLKLENAAELLEYADSNDGHIFLCDDQAIWGEFEDLEEVCWELQLCYDRQTEAKYEYNAEKVIVRPGMNEPMHQTTDSNGHALVAREEVEKALNEIKVGNTTQAISILNALCPEVPLLPRFEIK